MSDTTTQPTSRETLLANVITIRPLLLLGMLASGIVCAVNLYFNTTLLGWPAGRAGIFAGLATGVLAIELALALPSQLAPWAWRRAWLCLLLIAGLYLGIQSMVADSFLQPLLISVAIIYAVVAYAPRQVILIALAYLATMNLGIWLHGHTHISAYIYPTIGYATLMTLCGGFAHQSLQQAQARRRTDRLAADLAAQRDYLARLVEVTASLTHELDPALVLERVAAQGRELAHAGRARVWLDGDEQGGGVVQLAAAVPGEQRSAVAISARWGVDLLEKMRAHRSAQMLVLPLISRGAVIGVLEIQDPQEQFTDEDLPLLEPFANTAAIAIENARLYRQAGQTATLSERNRLARELHDTIAQGLTAVTMQLEAAQRSFDRDTERTRKRIGRALELTRETLDDVRRSVWTLAAPLVDGATLPSALRDMAERCAARAGIDVIVEHHGPPPQLDNGTATQILRIVQEALQNVEKHAHAQTAWVSSTTCDAHVQVTVRDDGVGFAADQQRDSAGSGNGFGLISLRERARLAGGTVEISSTPGAGTQIIFKTAEEHHRGDTNLDR